MKNISNVASHFADKDITSLSKINRRISIMHFIMFGVVFFMYSQHMFDPVLEPSQPKERSLQSQLLLKQAAHDIKDAEDAYFANNQKYTGSFTDLFPQFHSENLVVTKNGIMDGNKVLADQKQWPMKLQKDDSLGFGFILQIADTPESCVGETWQANQLGVWALPCNNPGSTPTKPNSTATDRHAERIRQSR